MILSLSLISEEKKLPGILLTQYDGAFLGPIAKILGILMNAIFDILDVLHIPNIGLAIILFTIIIYLLMTPLTVKQQKFSKLSAKMNPEIQAIQKKYKNKRDDASMMAMNDETKAVYAKYGVSPTGSCVQLLIQMPVLFALYRVIYAIPAYVTKVKDAFSPLVDKLVNVTGSSDFLMGLSNSAMYRRQFESEAFKSGNAEYIKNTFIDCLNRASTEEWTALADKFPELSSDISNTMNHLNEYNNFLGLNMGNSPSFMVKHAIANGSFLLIIGALAIPFLAAFTQWLNTKLMPQANNSSNGNGGMTDSMSQSMKTMNIMMPIMSAFFCYTLPAGMGLYWIAGAVVRSVQQVIINHHIDKMDFDEIVRKNEEKYKKKLEKSGYIGTNLNSYTSINTKNIDKNKTVSQQEKDEIIKKTYDYNSTQAKPGSISAMANLVKEFNEKNNK